MVIQDLKNRIKSKKLNSDGNINIKTLYESREKVIKLFNGCSKMAFMANYEAKHGKRTKNINS